MDKQLRLAFGGALALFGSGAARAEYLATAGVTYRHEDNLFRTNRRVSDVIGLPRSDNVYGVNGQLDVVFHPRDFNVSLGATAGQDWYDRNSQLDNFYYGAELNVQRAPGATIGFNLNARTDRRLSSFADLRSRIRNVQTLHRISNETTVPIAADLRLVLQPDYIESQNSNDIIKVNDFRQYGGGVGLGYYSPLGNSIAVTISRRWTDGLEDRPVLVPGVGPINSKIDLVDTALNLRVRYALSVLTSISTDLSYVDRKDQSILGRDYKGPAGSVTLDYRPRETLSLTATAGRRLDAQSYLFVDSIRTDFIDVNTRAIVADRTRVDIGGTYFRRRYNFDPTFSPTLIDRRDNTLRLTAALGYRVFDRVDLGVSGAYERRRTNFPDENYSARVVQLSASVEFGDNRR